VIKKVNEQSGEMSFMGMKLYVYTIFKVVCVMHAVLETTNNEMMHCVNLFRLQIKRTFFLYR
jgi:hypothetical protein